MSPKLHEVYAEDGMTLEQLMAFSVTADHTRQEQVWENVSRSGYDEPYQIRRMLTENTVRGSDRRALYLGIDAYQQAGGSVLRDLFEYDDGGWLQDVALLDRLVTEKLKAEAEIIAAEGWKWISVAVDFPFGHTSGLRELEGRPVDLTIEEQTTIDALNAEHDRLEAEYQDADELPDAIDQRLGEIEAALLAFEERSVVYDPADILRAGVFISINSEGRLSVDRGYIRPEDEAPVDDPEIGQGVETNRRQLSWPGHQAPHSRGRSRSERRCVGATDRSSEEGRHGQGGRAPSRWFRLVAGADASRRHSTRAGRAGWRSRTAARISRGRRGPGNRQ